MRNKSIIALFGQLHPSFKPGSSNLNIRNGVGLPSKIRVAVMHFIWTVLYPEHICLKKNEQIDGNFGVIIDLAVSE